MRPTRESLTNKKGLVTKLIRDQPLVGYAFIAAILVLHQASSRGLRLGSGPARTIPCHDLAEQADHMSAVDFAKQRAIGCPNERNLSRT